MSAGRTIYTGRDDVAPRNFRWWASWTEPDVDWNEYGTGPTEEDAILDLVTNFDLPNPEAT